MRLCLVALLFVPTTLARAGENSPASLSRDMLALLQEAKPVLAGIKDRKTAEAAKPKLAKLGERFAKLMRREGALPKSVGKDSVPASVRKDLEKVSADVYGEMERIARIPDAMKALRGDTLLSYFGKMQDARRQLARVNVGLLERAVEAWATQRRGQYPPSLESLTQKQPDGTRPTLEPRHLIDPWGRPYVYEPNTLNPRGGRPLIYSHGPRPGDPASRIANWTVAEKK